MLPFLGSIFKVKLNFHLSGLALNYISCFRSEEGMSTLPRSSINVEQTRVKEFTYPFDLIFYNGTQLLESEREAKLSSVIDGACPPW